MPRGREGAEVSAALWEAALWGGVVWVVVFWDGPSVPVRVVAGLSVGGVRKRAVASERRAAAQEGSRTTMGRSGGNWRASWRRLWWRTRRAMPSWPVEIQVRPQQTAP